MKRYEKDAEGIVVKTQKYFRTYGHANSARKQENDLASKIEYDYTKNHLWEDKRYELDKGYYVELSMNTDGINRVNIVLFNEDEEGDWVEWFTDRPECIEENIRYLIDLYID